MGIEVNAQDVINSLLAQNQQLVAEITVLKISLGMSDQPQEQTEESE